MPDTPSASATRQYVLHLIPSGMFHPHITCVIGNGVVIDPAALMGEIAQLEAAGISIDGRLLISHNAHLIMPYHKQLDAIREQTSTKIGTTGRGIGPAYIDKFLRVGIRIVDLLDRDVLARKLKANIEEKNQILTKLYGETRIDVDAAHRGIPGVRPADRRIRHRHRPLPARGAPGTASGSSPKGRREHCSTSTTGPIPTSPPPTPPPAAPAPDWASPRPASTRSSAS